MSLKRKHITLTLDKKYEILKRLENGEKVSRLSKEFDIGRATIHDIKKKKDQIESYFKINESSYNVRKTLKAGDFPEVEDALYAWFIEERNRETHISGEILMEKAKMIYHEIMNKDDFRASVGWLDRFKRRYGIRLSVPQGSPSSTSPVPIAPKKSVPPPPPQPSQPPEVCLKWNSYHSNMQATFPSLLNNEQFVDVTLACEGRSIKCHKVMLSACSSYFEELLSQNPCQHPIVFMRDLKFWEVQALVEFMYSGEVNVAQEKLPSLLAAAEALQIKGLTGPSSTSSNHDDDPLGSGETDDGHPQPQKRIRKRKSAHPVAYPIRIQNTPSPSPSGNQMQTQQTSTSQQQQQPQQQQTPLQVQKIKVPIMSSLPGSSHHREEPSYHPPVRIKREHSSTPPLALLKDEPLDLGIDSSERNKEENNGQVYNSTLQDAINRLHGKQLSLNQVFVHSGPGLVKMESNGGLSEDDGSGSERSPIQTDPGEAGDA
ncbi:protein bric-a-brac 1 isoform X3 [Halyomorpha halys]|uniref:protein bric-a-brac 1 isoform X3 n=1 Tax=Halyomorpha halys TaxID=286706 RepID=UPI0006D5283E|nr:protein bric-a-brac 1-like isoform X3 [Halyomorpha halys]